MRKRFPLLAAVALAVVLVACNTPNDNPPTAQDPTRPEGVITGIITSSAGTPLSNAPVTLQEYTLEGSALQLQSSSFTDEHGQFGLDITNSGTYALQANGENEGVFELITVTSEDGKLTGQDLELTSAEYGILELTVHAPDNTPAAGSLVYLAGTNHIGMTNDAGRTTLTRVPAGNYTAVATSEGYGRAAGVSVTVKSAETTTGEPLVLKSLRPVIHSITPAVALMTNYSVPTLTIRGENFGNERGLSQALEAAGNGVMIDSELLDGRILSWSDNEIVLETYSLSLQEIVFDDPTTPNNWNRFQIVTTAGASTISDRVEALYATFGWGHTIYVDAPADPVGFGFTLQANSAKVIADATVTHTASTGDLTYGSMSDIDTYEEPYGDSVSVSRSAYMNLTHVPAATQAGDTFTITSAINGEVAAIYECTLRETEEWDDTDWRWDCLPPTVR